MIHIVIAEDKGRLAAALRADVELCADFTVTAIYPDGNALLVGLPTLAHSPEVVLMDVEMPGTDGIAATARVKESFPQIRVIMTTVFEDPDVLIRAVRAGADGYLLKGSSPEELERAVREALAGGAPMTPVMARKSLQLLRRSAPHPPRSVPDGDTLTPRECEVLEQLAAGLTYRATAGNLYLSEATVRKHVENIYRKLRVNNKVAAIQRGRGAGWID